MYGFTFTKAYADGDLEDALFMDYWKDLYFDLDLDMGPLLNLQVLLRMTWL